MSMEKHTYSHSTSPKSSLIKHNYLEHLFLFSSPFSEQPALSEPQYTTPPCYAMHPPSLKPGTAQYLHS